MSYLIMESALVRYLSLEMVDWLVSSHHVRVIQIPASYSVIKGVEIREERKPTKEIENYHLNMSRKKALKTKEWDPYDLVILWFLLLCNVRCLIEISNPYQVLLDTPKILCFSPGEKGDDTIWKVVPSCQSPMAEQLAEQNFGPTKKCINEMLKNG